MLSFHDCCGLRLPVPLFYFIYISWGSSSRFSLLLPPSPSPSPRVPSTRTSQSHIHLKHMECHCNEKDAKRTRAQSGVLSPVESDTASPWRRGWWWCTPSAKWRGSIYSVVLLAHTFNAHTLLVSKRKKLTIYKSPYQTLCSFVAIFAVLAPLPTRFDVCNLCSYSTMMYTNYDKLQAPLLSLSIVLTK